MCYEKSLYEPRILRNPLSSHVAACLLEVVAYYYGCSSSHNSGCSDYSGYFSNPGPGPDSDSDSGTCFDMYYLHTIPVIIDSADSHIVLALLSSAPIDNPLYYVDLHKIPRYPRDYSELHSLYLATFVAV